MKALSFYKTVVLLIVLPMQVVIMAQASSSTANKSEKLTEFKIIEWSDLMPQQDLDALLNPPEYLADIEDGSIEDQISSPIGNSIAADNEDRYQHKPLL